MLARLLVITFFESLATTLIERGIYFYSHDRLGFSDAENLGLALGFGVAYAAGALASHSAAARWSEKRLLGAMLVAQFAAHAALFACAGPYVLAFVNTIIGGLNGLKWPVIESYVNAGRTPAAQAGTVWRFNLSWAPAVVAGLALAGPLIGWWSPGMFAVAAAMNAGSLGLAWPLPRRPAHLPADHPERPAPGRLERLRCLLASARWSMLASYALMWILAALLPRVFADLSVGVGRATAFSGLLDVFRTGAFLVLGLWRGWHWRRWPLVVVIFGLPAGFFASLYGPDVATVLAGEMVFGLAAGGAYYAALYYAMVVKNAAVEAGGAHEGLIGAGFAVGPLAGLAGGALGPVFGSAAAGMAAGVGPVILTCAAGAAYSLLKARVHTGRQAHRAV